MISREELLNSKEYWLTELQVSLYNEVEQYLHANKMSKREFADKLGVSKGYISQILNGDFDHKLSKLIELSLAIGKAPMLNFQNLNKLIKTDKFKDQIVKKPLHAKSLKQKNNLLSLK